MLRNQDFLIPSRDFQAQYSTTQTQDRHCRTIGDIFAKDPLTQVVFEYLSKKIMG